jgi:hypothetical protein
MIKFGSAVGFLSVLSLVASSPIKRQAAPADPQTTVTAFIPGQLFVTVQIPSELQTYIFKSNTADGGPPRGTFYVVTGVNTNDNDDNDDDDDDSRSSNSPDDDDKTYLVSKDRLSACVFSNR